MPTLFLFLSLGFFNFDVRFLSVFASHGVKLQSAHMDGVIVSMNVMFFWLIFQLILKTELCNINTACSVRAENCYIVYNYNEQKSLAFTRFYRAMHFSAKRGIAIACRLSVRPSVCLSVCNVGEL